MKKNNQSICTGENMFGERQTGGHVEDYTADSYSPEQQAYKYPKNMEWIPFKKHA